MIVSYSRITWCIGWLDVQKNDSGKASQVLQCRAAQATLARARRAALAKAQKEEAEEKPALDHIAEGAARRRARETQGGGAPWLIEHITDSAAHTHACLA